MDTKEKIFTTSLYLFAKQGIKQTSTSQITAEVGVAEGTLFRHFPTKQALIDQIYIQIKEKSFLKLVELIDETKSVRENIEIIVTEITSYFIQNYDAFRFIELVEADPIVSQEVKKAGQKSFLKLVSYIDEWTGKGHFSSTDSKFITNLISGMIITIIKHCHQTKQSEANKKQIQTVWAAIRKYKN